MLTMKTQGPGSLLQALVTAGLRIPGWPHDRPCLYSLLSLPIVSPSSLHKEQSDTGRTDKHSPKLWGAHTSTVQGKELTQRPHPTEVGEGMCKQLAGRQLNVKCKRPQWGEISTIGPWASVFFLTTGQWTNLSVQLLPLNTWHIWVKFSFYNNGF